MDPTEQDFDIVQSAHIELGKVIGGNTDLDSLAINLTNKYRRLDTLRPNLFQMERMSRLVGMAENSSDLAMKHFFCGEIVAFQVLQQLNQDDYPLFNYRGLNAVHDYARTEVYIEFGDSHYSQISFDKRVGAKIAELIERGSCFNNIDDQEERLLAGLFNGISDDAEIENEFLFDLTYGYRLVRMAETWHAKQLYLKQREDQDLQVKIDEYNNQNIIAVSNAKSTTLIHEYDQSTVDLEPLQPCSDDFKTLNSKLTDHIESLPDPDIYDPIVIEDVQSRLADAIVDDLIKLETLKLRDSITVIGNMVALIYDSDDKLCISLPIDQGSTLRGVVVDTDIKAVPTQAWVDRALETGDGNITESDLNPYGLVLELTQATITRADGVAVKAEQHESFYLAIEHSGIQAWRDPNTKVED